MLHLVKLFLGICRTKKPKNSKSWKYSNSQIDIYWSQVPELRKPCNAIRLEGRHLPERLLVVYGIDGQYHVFRNRCPRLGRRLDPVSGTAAVRTCSISGSIFDYRGNVLSGAAKDSLKKYPVQTSKCKIIIQINETQ
jgi:nitrite reductase/ring-hydroxylating ferredoxin subunit